MADQAAWIHQVLARQAPRGAHIVGHSFGGATAAAYARHYPTEVQSLTLLEPVFTFSYPSARLMAWTMVASLPGLPTGWRNHALGRIGGTDYDPTEPMARMIDAGTHHYDAHLPTPSLLSDDDVRVLTMPCYVAIASTALSPPATKPCAGQVSYSPTPRWMCGRIPPIRSPCRLPNR